MENKNLYVLRQIVEKGFGDADLAVIDNYVHDDWIEHQFNLQGGKDVLKKAIVSLATAFSHRKYVLQNYAVSNDIVWVHYRMNAIHTGPFMGQVATGRAFTIDVMDIAKIEDGKLVEHWGIPDRFALLLQLGLLQKMTGTVNTHQ